MILIFDDFSHIFSFIPELLVRVKKTFQLGRMNKLAQFDLLSSKGITNATYNIILKHEIFFAL